MKRLYKYLLIFNILSFFLCGECAKKRGKSTLEFYNNSEKAIGHYFALGGRYGNFHPDTVLPARSDYVGKHLAGKKSYYYDFWESYVQLFASFPQDTLSIYVFSSDTLAKYPWEVIRQ